MTTTKEHFLDIYKHRPLIRYFLLTIGYTFYTLACVGFPALLPLIIIPMLVFPRFKKFIFTDFINLFMFFLTRKLLPLIRLYRIAEEKYPDAGTCNSPVIYVANHRSQLDGPIILSRLRNTGVIMKSSYAKAPVFASFVKNANFISVDPSSLETLNTAMMRSREIINKGTSLLVFPEGSRSRSSKLQQFKDLAFRLSIDTDIPVIPVIIHTDYPIMAKIPDSLYPPEVMRLTIRALPAVKAEKGERPSEFANRVRKYMADEIKSLDKNTYWEHL